ncbi:hypothetical protein M988_2185 [Hafnia paralvei ATCC 29927]|nr:hypothetical protein M988_2185 [Hafnia paralvei ATCC 29927]
MVEKLHHTPSMMIKTGLPWKRQAQPGMTITRCLPLSLGESQPTSAWQWAKLTLRRVAQSFRLMVGIQDYQNYLRHQQLHHPELTPMSEREFHRYCLEARFPSQGGKLGKCPC